MEREIRIADYVPEVFALTLASFYYALIPLSLQPVAPPLAWCILFFYQTRFDEYQTIPLSVAVACGVFMDVYQALPLGTATSAYMIFYALCTPKEEPDEALNFSQYFLSFSWKSAIAMVWIYGIMSLWAGQFYPPLAPAMQWLILVAAYPLMHRLCFFSVPKQLSRRKRLA